MHETTQVFKGMSIMKRKFPWWMYIVCIYLIPVCAIGLIVIIKHAAIE